MSRCPVTALALLLTAALHAPAAPPATTRAATRPAATTATTAPSPEDEKLSAEIEAAWAEVLPKEVTKGKKDPTDEQKMLLRMLMWAMVGADKTPDRIKEADENRRKGRETLAAAHKSAADLRAQAAGKSPAIRAEADKAAAAIVESVQLFDRLTASAVTADATDDQIARATAEHLRDLPRTIRRAATVGVEAKYRAQRLSLLQKLDDFRHQATTQPADSPARRTTDQQAAAHEALLKALDAKYDAQQQILKLTPLGHLNNSMIE